MNKIFIYVLLCCDLTSGSLKLNIRGITKNDALISDLIENSSAINLADDILASLNKNVDISFLTNSQNGFSGLYIDNDNSLHIAHTKNDKTNYTKLINELNVEKIKTAIDIVPYTLDSLMKVKNYLDENLYDLISEINLLQSRNKVIVSLSNETYKQVILDELQNNLINFENSMVEFEIKEDNIYACRTINAGEEIIYKTGWWIFATEHWAGTVGFNAIDNSTGQKGIVTCNHVAPIGYEMRNADNKLVGYANTGILNDSVDASFIPFDDQSDWSNTRTVTDGNNSFQIIDKQQCFEGAKVYLFGMVSGLSYGTVKSIYSSANVIYDGYAKYLSDVIQTDYQISQGDSGGPLTTTNNSPTQSIYGINFAADNSYAYTIKIDNILNALNISLY